MNFDWRIILKNLLTFEICKKYISKFLTVSFVVKISDKKQKQNKI